MQATEFREAIRELQMTRGQAAGFLRVTESAVSRWATAQREIPGPVAHLLEIALEAQEKGRISFARVVE